jgi:hypothetical protein
MPEHVLGAAAQAYEPGTRAASAPGRRRRYGGGADEPAPRPVGVTGHQTQRPRGQVGPPGPHPAQPRSSLDPGGERRPISPPLAPMIAQLVVICVLRLCLCFMRTCTRGSSSSSSRRTACRPRAQGTPSGERKAQTGAWRMGHGAGAGRIAIAIANCQGPRAGRSKSEVACRMSHVISHVTCRMGMGPHEAARGMGPHLTGLPAGWKRPAHLVNPVIGSMAARVRVPVPSSFGIRVMCIYDGGCITPGARGQGLALRRVSISLQWWYNCSRSSPAKPLKPAWFEAG